MLPKVCFEVVAGLYMDFVNFIVEKEIFISNITATDFGFTAVCFAQDYRQIARMAKKFGCRTKIIKKKGLYFTLRRCFVHKGIFVGAAVVLLCLYMFSNIIWRIDVIAPTQNITQDVLTLYYKNGFCAGAVFAQEKNQNIIQQIFMNVDNVGYVTSNFYKGILTCKVDARVNIMPYLENQQSGNITATQDGVIEKLEVYTGFSNAQIGQSVQKGQLLVSSTYIDRNGTLQQVMPRAFIQAHCVKYYQAQVLFDKTMQMRTGEFTDRVVIKLLNRDFTVKKESAAGFEDFETERTFEAVNIFGFRMPLTIETTRYYFTQPVTIAKDKQSACTAAKRTVDTVVASDKALVSADSMEYAYNITEEGVTAICRVTGHYDITK